MANILDRCGIKEVADVMFYEIDRSGEPSTPVIYLDTLKVSTIETTAENTSARGGKGNPELITWDYGKEITITLEDALFSAKSMALMFGDINGADNKTVKIKKTLPVTWVGKAIKTDKPTFMAAGRLFDVPVGGKYYQADGTAGTTDSDGGATAAETDVYYTFDMDVKDSTTIEINPDTFPGTYYITGDTYARSEVTGKDEFFQFIVPKAKVLSEVTLTMEAEGDPSTFSMNLKVLRPKAGPMMKLVKYDMTDHVG